MYNFKSQIHTIEKLITSTKNGDIQWLDGNNSNKYESYTTLYPITKEKSIGIEIVKYKDNHILNYWVRFLDKNGNQMITYYYQNNEKIFDLFIYAKFINYIIKNGSTSFISQIESNYYIYNWIKYDDYFITNLETSNRHKKRRFSMKIFQDKIEFLLDGYIIYSIKNRSSLFNKLKKIKYKNNKLTNETFINFLKNNDVYDRFIYNCKNDNGFKNKHWSSLNELCNELNAEEYFTYAFNWSNTKEGGNFWYKLSIKWEKYLRNK